VLGQSQSNQAFYGKIPRDKIRAAGQHLLLLVNGQLETDHVTESTSRWTQVQQYVVTAPQKKYECPGRVTFPLPQKTRSSQGQAATACLQPTDVQNCSAGR